MHIAVLGTSAVGRAVASRTAELGHTVLMGTRDPSATAARDEFAAWHRDNEAVQLATFAQAASGADLVINATGGDASLAALRAAGELAGQVILDISNPLDHAAGFPPTLFVANTDSLGEQIQLAFPAAHVVKALNTMNNAIMVRPRELADGDHTVFVCGNSAEAKALVTGLLQEFGHRDVFDLGDITAARGTEMYIALWLRIAIARGKSDFNIKVVR
ncbi:NADPH-dependent F420 reductase [Hamadaea tsunoensis]|uniref:NADPH-dependent F420 reductase n=1 Tax=Hamadaea tsunoensis TaxID=53368 RepID=UPI00040C2877|nr:NAD(P)-binding domain-containing protein [Hamadaea tsunoensis]